MWCADWPVRKNVTSAQQASRGDHHAHTRAPRVLCARVGLFVKTVFPPPTACLQHMPGGRNTRVAAFYYPLVHHNAFPPLFSRCCLFVSSPLPRSGDDRFQPTPPSHPGGGGEEKSHARDRKAPHSTSPVVEKNTKQTTHPHPSATISPPHTRKHTQQVFQKGVDLGRVIHSLARSAYSSSERL